MLMLKPHFKINNKGHLQIGGADAVELAKRFGTPLYVVDEQRVRENYRRFHRAFADRWSSVLVCYALKANSNLAICKILQSEGAGAEVSSINELRNSLEVGIPAERIVFNGNYKSIPELELAIANEVLINVDNFQELDTIESLASRTGKKARIGFRVNPDVKTPTHPHLATGLRENKFGFDVASGQALRAYELASKMKNVEVVGIHAHIGSQILNAAPFEKEAKKLMALTAEITGRFDVHLKLIDFGGGLGIPYKPDEQELSPEVVADRIVAVVKRVVRKKDLAKPTLVFEPGRYVVGDAGVLLARVGYTKSRPDTLDWIALDAGMNALIRPALYGAYHHIELANKMREKNEKSVNVAGPLCESGDFLGKERLLPRVEPGDTAAIFDVGAYGLAMSSQHTAQPRPAMVLVRKGKGDIIRQRESHDDLTRLDRIPGWLA